MNEVLISILLPFAGTALGAACVFFMREEMNRMVQHGLMGFAAGVMTAASVWSLLIPAMEQSSAMGKWSFLPAFIGVWLGMAFLLILDEVIPHLHVNSEEAEGPSIKLPKSAMMVFAVILHNIPEGMAVGVVCAGWLTGHQGIGLSAVLALALGIAIQNFPEGAIISMPLRSEGIGKMKAFSCGVLSGHQGIGLSAVLALALGIAIQNFPEGAIISMPLRSEGVSKAKAFTFGVLSGVVEPIGALLTICLADLIVPALPYLLGFAAGAMLYVVVEDLIPEMSVGQHSNIGTICFAAGFTLMMALDVALG